MKTRRSRLYISLAVLTALLTALLAGCKAGYRSISVVTLTGSATVAREGQSGEISAYEGMKLQEKDVLTVSDTGSLVLKLDDDKYAYLEPGTQIAIAAADGGKTTIELLKGAMSAEIQKKLAAGESFNVTVNNISMVVRGTIFRIELGSDADGNPTVTVQTVEGEVAVEAGGQTLHALGDGLEDVVLLTDSGGTMASIGTPIDYSELPPETLDWIRAALEDKLNTTTDPEEKGLIVAILAVINGSSADNAAPQPTDTPAPTATPEPTPEPTPTPEPAYEFSIEQPRHGKVYAAAGPYFAGDKISVSAKPYANYRFKGWLVNGAEAPELGERSHIKFTMPHSDTTISAAFAYVPPADPPKKTPEPTPEQNPPQDPEQNPKP